MHRSGLVDRNITLKTISIRLGHGSPQRNIIGVMEHSQGMNSDNFYVLIYSTEHSDVAHDGLNPLVYYIL